MGFLSCAPDDVLHELRRCAFVSFPLHALLAGLAALLILAGEVPDRFHFLGWLALWSILPIPLLAIGFFALCRWTRRARDEYAMRTVLLLVMASDILLLGAAMVAQGMHATGCPDWLWPLVIGSHLLMMALAEAWHGRRIWKSSVASGRIDLTAGTFDSRIPPKGGAIGSSVFWHIPLAAGPVAGVLIARMLRFGLNMDLRLVVGGCVGFLGSMMFVYMGALMCSIFWRINHWERQTGRKLFIPPPAIQASGRASSPPPQPPSRA